MNNISLFYLAGAGRLRGIHITKKRHVCLDRAKRLGKKQGPPKVLNKARHTRHSVWCPSFSHSVHHFHHSSACSHDHFLNFTQTTITQSLHYHSCPVAVIAILIMKSLAHFQTPHYSVSAFLAPSPLITVHPLFNFSLRVPTHLHYNISTATATKPLCRRSRSCLIQQHHQDLEKWAQSQNRTAARHKCASNRDGDCDALYWCGAQGPVVLSRIFLFFFSSRRSILLLGL